MAHEISRPVLTFCWMLCCLPACTGETEAGVQAEGPGGSDTSTGSSSSSGAGATSGFTASAGETLDGSTTGATSDDESTASVEESSTGAPAEPVELQILALNDFHGHLEPPSGSSGRIADVEVGGAAHLAAHLERLREGRPHSITVSAGDLIGASPLVSALLHDEPSIDVMNVLGLELDAVGNHEFDEGWPELLRMQDGGCHPVDGCVGPSFEGAQFDFLAANVTLAQTGDTLFDAVAIRSFGGIEVAFIGMTLDGTPDIVTATAVEGLEFADEIETVAALVPGLRARGVEAIVVLLHEGGRAAGGYDGCEDLTGPIVPIVEGFPDAVDVVVTGHTHRAYNCRVGDTLVTGAASYGRVITEITLTLDPTTGDVTSGAATNHLVTRDLEDSAVAQMVAEYVELAAPLSDAPVGRITSDLTRSRGATGQSVLGAIVADAQLDTMRAESFGGAQVALMNPGGLRADLLHAASDGEAEDGIVTFGELFDAQPFGNQLATLTLTAQQFDALLEQQFELGVMLQVSSSLRYAYRPGAPVGNKVELSDIRIDGSALQTGDVVRVAVNGFLAGGGDGFDTLTAGTDPVQGPVDLDALEAWFEARSPISPPDDVRVVTLD